MGKNFGLLILRIGIGFIFFYVHGYPKLMGGMAKWTWAGSQMALFGITFAPAFWGFMAAVSECIGGLLLMIGFATRLAASLMAFTMFVACSMHFSLGEGLSGAAYALSMLTVFASIVFSGAGTFSLDRLFSAR